MWFATHQDFEGLEKICKKKEIKEVKFKKEEEKVVKQNKQLKRVKIKGESKDKLDHGIMKSKKHVVVRKSERTKKSIDKKEKEEEK